MTGPPPRATVDEMRVFDRALVRAHRDRAAPGFSGHDFLVTEVARRLADRLKDVNRRFSTILDLGCHTGQLAGQLAGQLVGQVAEQGPERKAGQKAGQKANVNETDPVGAITLVQTDISEPMLARAGGLRVGADEEVLPFADRSFDLVMSALSLHWVNDLPGTLVQINRCLEPDGLFLGAVLGGDTLCELRAAFLDGELETTGGVRPHVSPFARVRDAGGLLQRAGFALVVADTETITVTYRDPFALMTELRGMGEANALAKGRPAPLSRATLAATAAAYARRFGTPDGRISATFEILYMTGWRPDPSQPRPLTPGSATTRLTDVLGSSPSRPPTV